MLTDDTIKKALTSEYAKLRSRRNDKLQIYANIIEIKSAYGLNDYISPRYVDVKRWIKLAFEDCDTMDFGYDMPRFEVFASVIDTFTPERQLALYSYMKRTADSYGYEIAKIEDALSVSKLRCLKDSNKRIQYLCHKLGCSPLYIWGSLLVILAATSLVLSKAPCESMVLFKTDILHVSQYDIANVLASALIVLFGIGLDNPVVVPVNFGGVLLFCAGKLFFFFFVANFVCQKVITYFDNLTNG